MSAENYTKFIEAYTKNYGPPLLAPCDPNWYEDNEILKEMYCLLTGMTDVEKAWALDAVMRWEMETRGLLEENTNDADDQGSSETE